MTQQELIYKVAMHEFKNGVKEIPGSKSHPRIELYHYCARKKFTTDDVPWCASAANFCHIIAALLLNPTSTEDQMLEAGYSEKKIEELAVEAGKIAYSLGLPIPGDKHRGPQVNIGTQSAAARSFLWNGRAVTDPKLGDTVIFKRTSDPTKGHVAFFISRNPLYVTHLGGNQSDAWTISRTLRINTLGYRRV